MDECNMRCTFCPRNKNVMKNMNNGEFLNLGTTMTLDSFKKVIDEEKNII